MCNSPSESVAAQTGKGVKLVLRSLAASFPGFASAAAAWNELEVDQRFARLEALCNRIESMGEAGKSEDKAVSSDREFFSLVKTVVEKAQLELKTEKLAHYANLLVHALGEKSDPGRFLEHHFAHLINRLHPEHVRTVQYLVANSPARLWDIESHLQLSSSEHRFEILVSILSELQRAALITIAPLAAPETQRWVQERVDWRDVWRVSWYEATSLGVLFTKTIARKQQRGPDV